MAIEVLLMDEVENLGAAGDVVNVAEGYARNFLLPRKLAAPVSEATRRRLVKLQQDREVARKMALESAKQVAGKLGNASCTIVAKASTDQKLYGSVTAADIVETLRGQGFVLDKSAILLEQPIKELGIYNIPVTLHPEVQTTVKVWVVEE